MAQTDTCRTPVIRVDAYVKIVLTAIALFLAAIALKPVVDAPLVQAQFDWAHIYIEPGTTVLRNPDGSGQVQGKVMVDRRTGDIWGFPTRSSAPYPVVTMSPEPPVSRPIYLGKFDFSAMKAPVR